MSGNDIDDYTIFRVSLVIIVSAITSILLPCALSHVPRGYSVYEYYPGTVSALVCSIVICLTAGTHQISLSIFVVLISLVSRGGWRWSLTGIGAMVISLGYKFYSLDTFAILYLPYYGNILLWGSFMLSGVVIGVVRNKRRENKRSSWRVPS
ncbi:hypothetical protein CCICO_00150 [Corynebacterium ciconiae DSM 44920]|nr:hypothetical protein CCICO_00150 [Corynebacterium ciconiae DSM 44920]